MENWTAENYLAHHGILKQKWGQRNGPPYPLNYSNHSAAEKRANPKGRIDGEPGPAKKKKKVSGTAVAAAAGVGIGVAAALASKPTRQPAKLEDVKAANNEYAARKQYEKNNPSLATDAAKSLGGMQEQINSMTNFIDKNAKDRPTYERLNLDGVESKVLQDAINRERLEIEYSKMFNSKEQYTEGEKRTKAILEKVAAAAGVAVTALTIATLIKQLVPSKSK